MVSGPPCQQCGYPLRWFADQNAWGCDRCRQMFPAQAQPQMQAMPAGAPPRKGSGMKLAIGGLVVIGAIVTIALVASGGHKNTVDAHALVLENLEAERDAVCACADSTCVGDKLREFGDLQEKLRAEVKLTHDELKKVDEIFAAMKVCMDKVPGTDLPPSQAAVVDEMLREGRQLRDRMCACADKACAASVIDDSQRWLAKYKPGFDALPRATREAAMAIAEAEKKCYDAVGTGASAPAKPAETAETASDEPPSECADWKAAIDRMRECDNFPKETAATFKKAYMQMADSWRQVPRAQLVAACKGAADSLDAAVKAACPE